MRIQEEDIPRIKKLCMHEAGHLVVAKQMEFLTDGMYVTVASDENHDGSIGINLRKNVKTIDQLQEYLRKRLKILYAGVLAVYVDRDGSYDYKGAAREWNNAGALDNAKIRELIQVLRNVTYPDTADKFGALAEANDLRNSIIKDTQEIIIQRYSLIEAIANKLFGKVENYNERYWLTEGEIAEIPEVLEFLQEVKGNGD